MTYAYRCTLCGEVTIAEKSPTTCSFCGVKARYVKALSEVSSEQLFTVRNLSDESRKNLLLSLNLVATHASYYKCVSENSQSETIRALFKRMAKITREHADIFRKYLELDPVTFQEEECSVSDELNIAGALMRIDETISLYRESGNAAREIGIGELFKGLTEVQQGMKSVLVALYGEGK